MTNQAQITEIPFPECVRIRRGMYISDMNQMVTEIVDNSVDEHFAGYCNNIAVAVFKDKIIVEDDGRGIPVTKVEGKDITQVEMAFTKLHAGGKFGKEGDGGYGKKTSGMHGVGGSCVQALSSMTNITVKTGGKEYLTQFEKGHITNHTHVVGDTDARGTTVEFYPDEEIWQDADPLNKKKLKKRLKQIAFLNPGLNMFYFEMDDNGEIVEELAFSYEEGVKSYIEELTNKKTRLVDILNINKSIDYKDNTIDIQVGMTYCDSYNEEVYTFCNNVATVDNGDHLTGFYMGLSSGLKKYCEIYNVKCEYKSDDVKEGIVAVVSVRVADPIFEGQAKSKLKMNAVRNGVKLLTEEFFLEYLDKNPDHAKAIINKIEQAAQARMAAQKAREIARSNKKLNSGGVPEKLTDCRSKNPEECEIYIVEGDSAGGSAKQGRDRNFQAILSVFGKIKNVDKARLVDVITNVKLGEFVKAIKTGIGEDFDYEKLRYHKIIVMSDADIDGYHISCLWLTFIYRYMKVLLENGHVYIACPPKYQVTKNKKRYFAYDEAKLEELKAELGTWDDITYLKGLGEMQPEELWDTTMNPETRTLIQVTVDDAEEAEETITLCMSKDSTPRKKWIFENAIYALED